MDGPTPEPPINPAASQGQPSGTKACPACGWVQEDWSHVCPQCEYLWPDRAQDPSGSQARLSQFQDQLAAKGPTPWLTLAIIGANFAIYGIMLLTGVPVLEPSVPSLLQWGANLGSMTTSGQWWRLFTCTFLHIGLIHILFNMFVLWDIGRFMERLIGHPGFAVVYLLSGLAGSVASMWWNPYIVSAGASGAIFGLYGCLIGYLLAGSREIPADVANKLRKNALIFLGYNLIWGLAHRGTDVAGHLGGLVGGLACGFALAKCLRAEGTNARSRINLQVLSAGLAILALAAASRPKTVDLQQEIARFTDTETRVQATYNQALQKARSGALSDQEFARLVEADVIGLWHVARRRLGALHGLPEAQTLVLTRVERYAATRERAWVVFAEALRHQDLREVRQANALHAEAEGQLKNLGK
jgi:rhomboid protease GluP